MASCRVGLLSGVDSGDSVGLVVDSGDPVGLVVDSGDSVGLVVDSGDSVGLVVDSGESVGLVVGSNETDGARLGDSLTVGTSEGWLDEHNPKVQMSYGPQAQSAAQVSQSSPFRASHVPLPQSPPQLYVSNTTAVVSA